MAPNSTYKELVLPKNRKSNVKIESISKEKERKDVIKVKNNSKKHAKRLNFVNIVSILCFVSTFVFYFLSLDKYLFKQPICNTSDDKEEFGYLAKTDQHLDKVHLHHVKCHEPGYRRERLLNSQPEKCGTLVYDELVPIEDAVELRKMAAKLVFELGETNYYSRESINLHWVNLHNVFRKGYKAGVFDDNDFALIKNTSEAAKTVISKTFGIPRDNLYFTTIAQFTRYRPMTRYSQFRHVDKVRSQSLVVTSILWLSTYEYDFGGGRTAFLTGGPKPFTPLLVEPKIGRFAAWTSGWENPHEVMQMLYGERLALIFAFTANEFLGEKDMDTLKNWSWKIPDNPFF